MSTRQFSTVGSGSDPAPVARIPGCRALAFCIWALFAAFSAQVKGECPSEAGLCKLVTLAEDSLSVHDLWAMGADVWSVEDGRIFVRVSDEILATLTARDLPYEMVYEDVYSALRERRRTRAVKRSESFLEYHDLDETVAAMQRIVDEHPDIAAMEVIGRSLEDQPIHALRISDNADTVEPEEPGMLVVGCHHAREWISVEVPLYIADYLTDHYLLEGDVTRLVNYTEVWIVPVLNPDGFLYSWTDDRLWRKNRRENGDGTNGVDLNRNYSIGFGDDEGSSSYTLFETYRGPFPFSEPETQTIRDLIGGSFGRTFNSALSYHNYSQLVMHPNGYTSQPTANAAYYRELAGEMERLINESHSDPQYDYVAQPSAFLYQSSGVFTDWAHHEMGVTAILIELRPAGWPDFFELPEDQIRPTCRENLPAFLYMAERAMIPSTRLRDADLDGFVNNEDFCPQSPASVAVDPTGCTAAEQDLDGDGVENALDDCRDSLPGQQVDSQGCRVEALFTVRVRSNVTSVEIQLTPVDIDAAGAGDTGLVGFIREYAAETTVVLDAPATSNGNHFLGWVVDGVDQPPGQRTVALMTAANVEAKAVYVVPECVEVLGSTRIPDRREDGLGFISLHSVQVVFSDGSTEAVAGPAEWSISDDEVAMITPDGELVAFDVSAEDQEVTTAVSAEVDYQGIRLTSEPLVVRIFDTDTLQPRCQDMILDGPGRVESISTHAFDANIYLDGDAAARTRSDMAVWKVWLADPEAVGRVPASLSDEGVLTTEWVANDSELTIQASYLNDDDSVCVAQKSVTISAGDPSDAPPGFDVDGVPDPCGATGMIGLFGLFVGLVGLRLTGRWCL